MSHPSLPCHIFPLPLQSSKQGNRGALYPPAWPPTSGPRPQGSPTLPGINHLSPQGMLFGRTLQPGLYPLDPLNPGLGAYSASVAGFGSLGFGGAGFRSGYTPSPQGMRGLQGPYMGGSFGQGLTDLGEGFAGAAAAAASAAAARGDQLTITSLDVAEGLGMHGSGPGGAGARLEPGGSGDGTGSVPRRSSQYTGLSTQQLLDAANTQIGEVGLGFNRPAQQGPMGASPAGAGRAGLISQIAMGSFGAAAAAAAAEAARRTQSSELEQQLAMLPPTTDAAGRARGGSNSQLL